MRRFRAEGQQRGFGALLLVLICVGLLLFAATLSATHGHPDGSRHADCGMCMTAQVEVIAATAAVLFTTLQLFDKISFDLPPAPYREFLRFALFTRPPPADTPRS